MKRAAAMKGSLAPKQGATAMKGSVAPKQGAGVMKGIAPKKVIASKVDSSDSSDSSDEENPLITAAKVSAAK